MIFQLPHGAWLPGGVQWQVDEGEAQRLPFNTSDPEGLYAGIAVTDDVLGALRRGTTLRLAVVAAAQRQVLNIPVALARMNEAFGEFVAQERAR
jgi:invasion protein IalB